MSTQKGTHRGEYYSLLVVAGACGISAVYKRLTGKDLGVPTVNGMSNLLIAMGTSGIALEVLQALVYLPERSA